MDEYKGKKGVWRTIRGRRIFIEEGKTLKETFEELDKAESLLNVELDDKKPIGEELRQRKETIGKAHSLMKSNALPKGVKPKEYLGGTMNANGNPVDMKKFKDGYLVSCGNDSDPRNREFLMSDRGKEFLMKFLEKSGDGELYVGSWFENGVNNNEPTIWVKNKDDAMRLAKATGQYAITDCAAYNRYGCANYETLSDEQLAHANEIFVNTCGDEEHKVMLSEVEI